MNNEYFPEFLVNCPCGVKHTFPLKKIISCVGAIDRLPEVLSSYGLRKPFIVADENTYAAAGEKTVYILEKNGFNYGKFLYGKEPLEPDEKAVGTLAIKFDADCDAIVGIGSGVINDICKIIAARTGKFYIIIATAPSMDGYASATSSMAVGGLKITVKSKCPEIIIGDVDVLKNAPLKMLKAGLGDMLAKYVSILEWRLSEEINGEYYCENIAQMIRSARDKCVDNAKGLILRDENAVKAVFDGLIIGGIAMAYAGASRPASGGEHYFSHILDMRGLAFGTKAELHGVQVAIGTLLMAKQYDKLKKIFPSEEKGYRETHAFSYSAWENNLREFIGGAAEQMILLEKTEGKYDPERAAIRRKIIIEKWDKLVKIMDEELPSAARIAEIMDSAGLPKTLEQAGLSCDVKKAFAATRDIRDKYVLTGLLWDIGELNGFCASM